MSGRHPMAGGASSGYQPSPCRATSKATGKPCGRTAEPGATVCRYHGGAAPQVKRKAALRLLELVDPAIATLAREMANADRSSDRQRAANSILDRAGVPRRVDVTDADAARALLIERLLALRDPAGEPVYDEAPDFPQIVQGSVVPDEQDPTTTEESDRA